LSSSRKYLALAALLSLAGCGFTPLYGGDAGQAANAQLDQVAVNNIPERPGQMLRISLQTQLHTAGAPGTELYALNVRYNIVTTNLGVLEDSATTRSRVMATASWSLSPIGNPGQPLVSGSATATDAANIIDQQYFALDLENDTLNQHLADTVAAQITSQLAAWFRAHPNA
jgi:LPS-assembly lipoprotein